MIVYLQNHDTTVEVPDNITGDDLADIDNNFNDYVGLPTAAPQPAPAPSASPAPVTQEEPKEAPNFYEGYVKPFLKNAGNVLAGAAIGGPLGADIALMQTEEGRAFAKGAVDEVSLGLTKPLTEVLDEDAKKHPVAEFAGKSVGGLGSLMGFGAVARLAEVPAAGAAIGRTIAGIGTEGSAVARLTAQAPRFAEAILPGMATFGTKAFYEKAVQAFQEGKIDLPASMGHVLKETGLGGVLGAAGVTASVYKSVATGAGVGFLYAKSEGADTPQALLQAGMFGLFELFGQIGKGERININMRKTLEATVSDHIKLKAKLNGEPVPAKTADAVAKKIVDDACVEIGVEKTLDKSVDALKVVENLNQKVIRSKAPKKGPRMAVEQPLIETKAVAQKAPETATPPPTAPEIQQPQKPKPFKVDRRKLPIRKPGSVVSIAENPETGEKTKITHKMIVERAEELHQEYLDTRQMSPLERFVRDNGGVSNIKGEKEEFKDLPIGLRGSKQVDKMAQEAFNAKLLAEPSADMLRSELKAIAKRGTERAVGDFYGEGQHDLEAEFSGSKQKPEELPAWVTQDLGGTEEGYVGMMEKKLPYGQRIAQEFKNMALERYGETKNLKLAGFVMPDGKMVDFAQGGDTRVHSHHESIEALGTILPDFMARTNALRVTHYGDIKGENISFQSSGPLSPEQIQQIDDYFAQNKVAHSNLERVNEFGRSIRTKQIDNPSIEDIAGFFNGPGAMVSMGDMQSYGKRFISETPLGDIERMAEESLADVEQVKRLPSGQAAVGSQGIDKFETIETPSEQKARSDFKLSEKSLAIVKKWAGRVGEKYLPRGAKGVFYGDTKNIRVNALNNLSTVTHEVTHFIDNKMGVTKPLTTPIKYGKNGQPLYNRALDRTAKDLTNIYVEYYPGGKNDHPRPKRMIEGLATFFQKYAEHPTEITEKYPQLVGEFLKPGGKFYKPEYAEFLGDIKSIVAEYQGLDPLEKIGARMTNIIKQEGIENTFLTLKDKLIQELIDNKYPIEKLAAGAGVQRTQQDPSLWLRLYDNSSQIILSNLRGNKGFRVYKNGGFQKVSKENIGTFIETLQKKGLTDQFAKWLVARRIASDYERLDQMRASAVEAAKQLNQQQEMAKQGWVPNMRKQDIDALKKTVNDYKALRDVLKADGFDRAVAEQAYNEGLPQFGEYAIQYDTFNQANLDMMADPEIGLITPDQHAQYSSNKGYTSFKRDIYDEIIGGGEGQVVKRTGKNKVSSTIRRKGGEQDIINPLYSLAHDHAEVMRKSLKQMIYNKITNLAGSYPDLFQPQELKVSVDEKTGVISYPQEKDPNIIMARGADGSRKPYLASKEIKSIVDELLDYKNIGTIEMLMRAGNRMFTKGTTALFPYFAPSNYVIDQITASSNTRNKYVPVIDSIKNIYKAFANSGSKENEFAMEYMTLGGEKQTFARWQDDSPDELFRRISSEKTALEKIVEYADKGMNILQMPSQVSEIATRMTEYVKSRMVGNPQVVALEDAGRVSVPFHHRGRLGAGTFGDTWLKSMPFVNPGIQALAQYYRSVNQGDTRNRALFVTMAVISSLVASGVIMSEYATEEQKQNYKDIEAGELARYLFAPAPDGKSLIRIRVPSEMATIGVLINMAIWNTKENAGYDRKDFTTAATAFLPDQINALEPVRLLLSVIPQVIKPIVGGIYNKKDYPQVRPIVGMGLERKEPRYQFNENTSKYAKWLGDKLNLSPIMIDYFVEGYFGRATKLLTGRKINSPFMKEWYFTAGRNLQDFYEIKKRREQIQNSVKNRERTFTREEYTEQAQMMARIKRADVMLDMYRQTENNPKATDAYKARLRTNILNEIALIK